METREFILAVSINSGFEKPQSGCDLEIELVESA